MMPKLLIILFFAFCSSSVFSVDQSDFTKEVCEQLEIGKDQKIITIYQSAGSCSKCYALPYQIIKSIAEEEIDDFAYLAIVRCKRDKELRVFEEIYSWKHLMLRDKDDFRKRYDLPSTSAVTIFDYEGNVIVNVLESELGDGKKMIMSALAELDE